MKFTLAPIFALLSCALAAPSLRTSSSYEALEAVLVNVPGIMSDDEIAFLDTTMTAAINALQDADHDVIDDAEVEVQEFHQVDDRRAKLGAQWNSWDHYSHNWVA